MVYVRLVVTKQKKTKIKDKPNIQTIDVRTVCRVCLAKSNELENIFNVFTAKMFHFCTSVKISKNDGLPDSLCQQCFWLLNRVYYFKQLALKSDTVLKQEIPGKDFSDVDDEEVGITDLFVDSLEKNAEHVDHNYCNIADSPPTDQSYATNPSGESSTTTPSGEDNTTTSSGQSNLQKKLYLPLQFLKTQPKEKRKAFKCPKCGKTTHDYEKLTQHLNMHLNEKLVNHKNTRLVNPPKVKPIKVKPIKVKPPKPLNYTCDICGVTLKSAYNYKNHLKRHTAERNIMCPICGKGFLLQFDLKNHLRRHTSLQFYKCDICDKILKTKKGLELHHRIHTGERPFECEFCDKRCIDSKALKIHRAIQHTGEANHKCEICDRRFYLKSSLAKHLRTHAPKAKKPSNCVKYSEMLISADRPHECEICRRAFARKCGLARHMKIHNKRNVKQNDEMQENVDVIQESVIDFMQMNEVLPNADFPINEQLQYAIMKVCSDLNKM